MKAKKLIKSKTVDAWVFSSVYSSFFKRNKIIYNYPHFKLSKLTTDEKIQYYNYWKRVSPVMSFKTVEITKSISGVFDKRILPEEFLPLYIERSLNSEKSIMFLENKSIYNKWFGREIFPKDFFHKIDDNYYTYDFKIIDNIENFVDDKISKDDFPIVIKPNKDTYGGKDINFVNTHKEIKEIIKQHANLVVQEKIEQSRLINDLNKDSINTVRVCLYRDNNKVIQLLNASVRMGVNGSLDNLSGGGIVCNIKPTGILNRFANDRYGRKYFEHPNSGYVFEEKKFPLYKELIEVSKEVAKDILDAHLISLDMCLDSDNKWRCIETNLSSQTILFAQFAGEPFFGEYTEEVILGLKK